MVFYCVGIRQEELQSKLDAETEAMCEEFYNEGFSAVTAAEETSGGMALSSEDTKALVGAIELLPNNTVKLKAKGNDFIAVANIGRIHLDHEVEIVMSTRSRMLSAANQLAEQCKIVSEFAGFEYSSAVRFLSWPYDKNSKLRKMAKELYRDISGSEMKEAVCPGGLEISIFINKIKDLDAFEMGVTHVFVFPGFPRFDQRMVKF